MPAGNTLYFDNHASTPLDPRVSRMVTTISDVEFGNPHADDHAKGWSARAVIDQARTQIADAIGALPDEIIFTSGATEADNIAVLGAALGAPQGRSRILVSAIEHKAVLESAKAAESFGFELEFVPVNADGVIDLKKLATVVGADVAVVSVMAVNNETGIIQPVKEVAAIGSAAGAFVHCDATQAPTAGTIDVFDWGVDAASFSSHKVYGPKGVGALYLSGSAPWRPRALMFGGGQEQGLRPGTAPTGLCAGFGLAMSLLNDEERTELQLKRDRLLGLLRDSLPGLQLSGGDSPRHPGNLHVRFPGLDAKDLVTRLQPRLSASTGSACTSGMMTVSHVLTAMGLSEELASEFIRFSLGRFTTVADVDAGALLIVEAIHSVQSTNCAPVFK